MRNILKNIISTVEITIQKIANQCCENEEERIIVLYGLHQGLLLLVHVILLLVCGIIWNEILFTLMVFVGTALIRPYTGGYHAESKLNCCLISLGLINIAILLRKVMDLEQISYIFLNGVMFWVIWRNTPIENPIHQLEVCEKEIYEKKSKKLLSLYGVLELGGILTNNYMVVETVTAIITIVAALLLMGKVKYKRFSVF